MGEKGKQPQSNSGQKRKPPASPVCYLDQFPGYFEGEENVQPELGDTKRKDPSRPPEP